MRKSFSSVVIAALIGFTAGPVAVAGAVAPLGTITIDGTAPFRDGQTITVRGSGLSPGEELFVEECESAAICNLRVGGPQVVAADGTVAVSATLVRYFLDYFSDYGDQPVDCSQDSCRLGFVTLDPDAEDGYSVRASVPITFDESLAWNPEVSVAPDVDLPPAATLRATGRGFAPASRAMARFCSASRCDTQVLTNISATGDLDVTLSVTRLGQFWDCLTEQCTVQVLDSRSVVVSETPLGFDPTQVAVVPELAASPDHDLALHDTVQVSGRNYLPGVTIRVSQCSDLETTSMWSCPSSISVSIAADGTFSTSLPVVRYVTIEYGRPVDCAVPGHCHIETTGGSVYPVVTVAPITFAELTDDPAIRLEGVTVLEGTATTPTVATARVVVDRPALAPIDVVWTTTSYETSAAVFADFGFRHEHAVIPVGERSVDLSVPIVADALDEPTESFDIQIEQWTNARLDRDGGLASVSILDDDRQARVDVGDSIVSEGAGHATVAVRLSAVSGRNVTVSYRTRSASAQPRRDYITTRGSVRIPAGTAVGYIQVPIVDDSRRERNEQFRVRLLDAHHARLGDRKATVWIGDDDAPVRR